MKPTLTPLTSAPILSLSVLKGPTNMRWIWRIVAVAAAIWAVVTAVGLHYSYVDATPFHVDRRSPTNICPAAEKADPKWDDGEHTVEELLTVQGWCGEMYFDIMIHNGQIDEEWWNKMEAAGAVIGLMLGIDQIIKLAR